MDEQDWLDRRLAMDEYVPDDGFAARVMDALPARRSHAESLRWRILAFTAVAAACLVVLQMVPLFESLRQLLGVPLPQALAFRAEAFLEQPAVLLRGVVAVAVLSLASIPVLRRWA